MQIHLEGYNVIPIFLRSTINALYIGLYISLTFLFTRRKGTLREKKTENNSKRFCLAPQICFRDHLCCHVFDDQESPSK